MKTSLLFALFLAVGCASTAPTPVEPAPQTPAERLNTTPRHDEWVRIPTGGRDLHAWVSYPERATKAPAVLLIHENRGLTDWVRSVGDRLAENGLLVIAPDLLSGKAPGGGRTRDFASEDAAREAISGLDAKGVMADLDAAANYVVSLPSANGGLSVAGFCWGGARAWDYANGGAVPLIASYVFYGTGPQDPAGVANIRSSVFGFYGGADERVNATIPRSEQLMLAAGKRFEPVIYDGAGHAFMRLGETGESTPENARARNGAWSRWLSLLTAPTE